VVFISRDQSALEGVSSWHHPSGDYDRKLNLVHVLAGPAALFAVASDCVQSSESGISDVQNVSMVCLFDHDPQQHRARGAVHILGDAASCQQGG
jgi:hypothetical protein